MEIKRGDFIPTNWTGEPTEVMGFQHADLGHNIVDAIVFRSYDEKCKTYVWAVGTYPYINEKRNKLVWERGDYYYTDSPDKLPEGLRMDRRDRIAVEGDLKLTKDAAALTDTNSMRELQPYETVKVSLPDGRALVIEASRDEQHREHSSDLWTKTAAGAISQGSNSTQITWWMPSTKRLPWSRIHGMLSAGTRTRGIPWQR